MKQPKNIYGINRTWDKAFWVYATDAKNQTVLVRCSSRDVAKDELGKMRNSDAVKIRMSLEVEESDIRRYCRERGWKVVLIRDAA